MFRIASQPCEVFDCDNQQLIAGSILDTSNESLKRQLEIVLAIASNMAKR